MMLASSILLIFVFSFTSGETTVQNLPPYVCMYTIILCMINLCIIYGRSQFKSIVSGRTFTVVQASATYSQLLCFVMNLESSYYVTTWQIHRHSTMQYRVPMVDLFTTSCKLYTSINVIQNGSVYIILEYIQWIQCKM